MNAEIICVGTELLLGNIVNTNAAFLSQKLSELGINVFYQSVVGDNSNRLKSNFLLALTRSDIVILTGGLGPTADDITKEIVAQCLELDLVEDEESRRSLDSYFAAQNRTPVSSNYKQCLAPRGAIVIPNLIGTAPGYCIEKNGKKIILLPGPPRELKNMFENLVYPYLRSISDSVLTSHYVKLFGVGESKAEELLGDLVNGTNPTVATYAGDGEVMIRVTAKAEFDADGEALCAPIIEQIKGIFKENIYAIDDEGLDKAVVNALKDKKLTVATAESCTGGMVAQRLTAIAGSSAVFKAGVVAYSNEIKQKELNVPENILADFGAVSEQTAAYMAINVCKKENSTLGIGITGVAGPDKSENKDVGLVFVALSDSENVWVRRLHLTVGYDRDKIRNYATLTALDLIRRYILFLPSVMPGANPHGGEISVLDAQPTADILPVIDKVEAFIPRENPIITDEQMADLMSSSFQDIFVDGDEETNQSSDMFETVSSIIDVTAKEKKERTPFSFKNTVKKLGSFILSLLPGPKNSIKDNVLKSLFIVSLAGLIISASYLLGYFISGNQQKELLDDTRKLWYAGTSANEEGSFDFDPLLKINKDTKAWIKINNTNIDNPVVQASNNDHYLNRNFSGEKSRHGTLFFDYRDVISENGNSKNLVIYGHNMKDGSMFAGLLKYKNLNFYKENPTIDLTTLYKKSQYRVFSVFIVNANPKDDNGYVFNFLRNSFTSDNEFANWIDEAKKRSLINTGMDVVAEDEILTLVTCAYDFNDARLVVMARKTRNGESDIINTSVAMYNPSPMYPQIWYDKRGIKNPYAQNSQPTDVSSDIDNTSQLVISSSSDASSLTSNHSSASTSSSGSADTSSSQTSAKPSTPSQNSGTAGSSSVVSSAVSQSSSADQGSSQDSQSSEPPVSSDASSSVSTNSSTPQN